MSGPRVPVIDLFAGPGGLGEGFSALEGDLFRIAISVEMEETAHETLRLRAFFRQFAVGYVPTTYYEYVRGEIPLSELQAKHPGEWEKASREAWRAELGVAKHSAVRDRVDEALGNECDTGEAVLIGGPPCQAYSLVGRSRMRRVQGAEFESDRRHFLYREYLKILADHAPAAFVLENVKGLLSSTHDGEQIFSQIRSDLRQPGRALSDFSPRHRNVEYTLFPLGEPKRPQLALSDEPAAEDFLLRAEELGLPQARHRVIIVGIRSDRVERARRAFGPLLKAAGGSTPLTKVLHGMPSLRSGLSRESDSDSAWEQTIRSAATRLLRSTRALTEGMADELERVRGNVRTPADKRGGRFVPTTRSAPLYEPSWFVDANLQGVLNHETRGHMRDDLTRYLFASTFGRVEKRSPQLADLPQGLLPRHENVQEALAGNLFSDRFRVQVAGRPSTTITSHISKDGHYYIHPDPLQCRSLTVREAARLQTFPDNYFFEGPRTKQYTQVGNAVPPLLARRVAEVVAKALGLLQCD